MLTAEELEARERIVAATVRRIRELELSLEEIERPARAAAARRACEAPAADAPAGDGPAAEVRATGARAAGPPAAGAPRPAARWTFEAGPADDLGALGGILEGGAAVAGGRLRLDGRGAFARSDPLPRDLREKTLEAWVSLASLDQRGGGVISVESRDGRRFDAIAFAERQARRWMAGSDLFRRTKDLEAPAETAAATELVHVAVVYGSDDRIAFYRNGVPHGKPYVPQAEESSLQTYRRGEAQVLFGLRHTGSTNGLLAGEIEEARVYDRALSNDEVAASFRAGPLLVGDREIDEALGAAERERRAALIGEIRAEREKLRALPPVPRAYAASPAEPGPTFVLARGDVEKKGEPVAAGVLSAVAGPPADFGLPDGAPEGQRRLAFAEWVAHPENPLTARVLANRLWQHHFGRGLVGTPSDFGSNGERPSHPDLLDWLATELVARGWSVKAIHRAIVLSSTYRQGSAHGGAARALAADAEDRLLWRFPLRRLEAEAVRDAMLRLSGQLDLRMGGPSFRPFTVTVSGSNFYHLLDDPAGPELDRRTVYRMGVHSGKDPLLDSLDCPDPSTRTPVRSVTTTPIQALGLMNDAFVLRQARALARRLEREAGPLHGDQVRLGYRLALGRLPAPEEAARAEALAREHGLEQVSWAILNSSELLFVR
ncbi:MAG: DUF1553 domain-containing protein [Planctomycetes bacterium]|nr:DUF1553 domain-containing protein [Planctomycetota bacterium]